MPLLVHPSSQCDVCLDPYSWTTPDSDKAPHAIQCGHIFCLRCLITVGPRIVCPLCRKPYNKERIKRLVVDKVDGDGSGPAGPVKVEIELFRRIAALFIDTPDNEDIRAVIEEVNNWVQAHPRLSGDASESIVPSAEFCGNGAP
ncbi:hypothetical protein PYCCODRAFT_376937 [Trametes coccinea BRFM310]|uniref:RING-type domain-containing protein n=1 Tax=Trametes coccinea (strain BRFM310) TaxID=1353009 RepID=A0A1Y2J531_TRAC3|nr:hypothetical protein PYCCODRAFT_376937 [Trametes coccinea BRFM310]